MSKKDLVSIDYLLSGPIKLPEDWADKAINSTAKNHSQEVARTTQTIFMYEQENNLHDEAKSVAHGYIQQLVRSRDQFYMRGKGGVSQSVTWVIECPRQSVSSKMNT